MDKRQDVYVVSIVRTPVGKAPRGVLKNTRPDDMLAHVIKGALGKLPEFDKQRIGDVIVGCAMPEGAQGLNVARIGGLLADLPDTVPGMTINRFCSSGVQSIALAADRIATGEADVMLAGGTESMSMVPMMGFKPSVSPAVFKDDHVAIAYGMGITAEKVAEQWKVSREDQDAFAERSHERALAAIQAGHFNEEILPVPVREQYPDVAGNAVRVVEKTVDTDEGPRPGTSVETLANLRPVFAARGSVTAGNSSQMSDGAGMAVLMSERMVKELGIEPLARFVSFAVAGVPPEIMGIGPIKAIPLALERAGIGKEQLDWIELNEAFAAQSLAVIRDVGLDEDKVNPLGGAIALGHPLGATGAIRAATAIHGLRRTGGRYGMVTMCIGTGMGAAGVFEKL